MWLFQHDRIHEMMYDVIVNGVQEKTVGIRGGIAWPKPGIPGYFVLVAQLDQTPADKSFNRYRFLAISEGQGGILNDLFEKISHACSFAGFRIDEFLHGDEPSEEGFSNQLYDYLKLKEKKYKIIQMPSIGKSWRCKEYDFLTQLVRVYIAKRELIFFNAVENRTPLLIERIRNTDMEADILQIPEIKALAHVMDEYEVSPWKPEPPPIEDNRSLWVV